MTKFNFYLNYAWRSLRRGGERSIFAILCIAVGITAIVALQSTGFAIENTLSGDARSQARADVVVIDRHTFFDEQDIAKFESLKQNGTIVDYTTTNQLNGLTIKKPDGSNSNEYGSFYLTYIVEPAKYPFYAKIELEAQPGKNLKDVLTEPNQLVLNSKTARNLNAKTGDTINVIAGNSIAKLKVVGVLTDKTPSPDTGQAEFTGYTYTNLQTARLFFTPERLAAQTVYVKTNSQYEENNRVRDIIKNLSPAFNVRTSGEVNDAYKQSGEGIRNLLGYVGLISLLIGSVGVVNTMLVVIGRRSGEIATLKALGMQSSQAIALFVLEATLLGLIGSGVGILLGEGFTLLISRSAEGFINRPIDYIFSWQPVWMGLVVGVVTSIVFSILPAYSASRIMPAQVLRQRTYALPHLAWPVTLVIVVIMTGVMGLLAGIILNGQFVSGLLVAFSTLVSCLLLVLLFNGLLWLVGKLPLPLGLSYKLSRRNLSRNRLRSAVTLLVLLVGVFAVSLVIILAGSLKDTLRTTIEQSLGFNVQLDPASDTQTSAILATLEAKQIPGQQKYWAVASADLEWISGGGVSANDLLAQRLQKENANATTASVSFINSLDLNSVGGINSSDASRFLRIVEGNLYSGNDQAVILKSLKEAYNLKLGDQLVYKSRLDGQPITLTIAGVYETANFLLNLGGVVTTRDRLLTVPGHLNVIEIMVEKSQVATAIQYLENNYPESNPSDLSIITNVFNTIIDNVTAFPILLGFLSLIAGAVLIANNVALMVLERRSEMGVMKSIGADNERIMLIINWETGLVGLLGSLLGFSLAGLIASQLVGIFGTVNNPGILTLSPFIFAGVLLLGVGLSVVATIISAWREVHEKPLIVLRYE